MRRTSSQTVDLAALSEDRFFAGTYTDAVGSLDYRLHLSRVPRKRPPLFVMLHGASQSALDFANGTRMHEVIDECGGMALFPEQSRSAHPLGSWNWYDAKHQLPAGGEPAMLAGLTRQIINAYNVDRGRVYVAGMSAGGAMAVILGQAFPDLYAAVGVHSGIPTGVAHDLMSALKAMNSGPSSPAEPGVEGTRVPLPTIVFHGDRDRTVHPANGAAVLAQALNNTAGPADANREKAVSPVQMSGGREVTLLRHSRGDRVPDAEMWIVHGGGHAWAGGSSRGSYTDEAGPDASREMLRFFLKQSRPPVRERKVA
jgi:poly(hydroxyalkanoate) depolymerase family esterase